MQSPGLFVARAQGARAHVERAIRSTAFLAALPGLCLGAFWLGGEPALAGVALGLPVLAALLRKRASRVEPGGEGDPRARLLAALDAGLEGAARSPGRATACIVLAIEGGAGLADRFGAAAVEAAFGEIALRLAGVLREADRLERLPMERFGVALAPMRQGDLETVLQIAARLQEASRAPVAIDGARVHLSAAAGFCLPSACPGGDGAALLSAAEAALGEARAAGPGALRAFSPAMQRARLARRAQAGELEEALESGAITPWFQPQIALADGAVSGAEALARWQHPSEGLIAPGAFLPGIAAAGLAAQLSGVMLRAALTRLAAWDDAGLAVARIGVNFSGEELRDPRLVDRIRWELDHAGLEPHRLAVEVLETVVASAEDAVIIRNIAALSELGCMIDLDDFGTGHASIATIRRLAIGRLKIDRSFVTAADTSAEQQDMLGAILSLANRLGLETLAEGVETEAERAALASMGCRHAQGFGIARPMPAAEMAAWLAAAGQARGVPGAAHAARMQWALHGKTA